MEGLDPGRTGGLVDRLRHFFHYVHDYGAKKYQLYTDQPCEQFARYENVKQENQVLYIGMRCSQKLWFLEGTCTKKAAPCRCAEFCGAFGHV